MFCEFVKKQGIPINRILATGAISTTHHILCTKTFMQQHLGIYPTFCGRSYTGYLYKNGTQVKDLNFPHNGLASYLKKLCVLVQFISGHTYRHSATQGDLAVPLALTFKVQHRNFAMVGPSFLSEFPSNLCHQLFCSFISSFQ